jgi:hypothetical protein
MIPPQHGDAVTSTERERLPPPGQAAIAMLALIVGLLLMAIQLWLLTLAFDLYQSGQRAETVGVAIGSGLVFLGGLVMVRFMGRRPRVRRPGRTR